LKSFDRLKHEFQRTESQCAERMRSAHAGENVDQITMKLRRVLAGLSSDLQNLQSMIQKDLKADTIGQREADRRSDQLKGYITRLEHMNAQMREQASGSARSNLMGAGAGAQGEGWAGRGGPESAATKDLDSGQILSLQQETMQRQDQGLDVLANSVLKQKDIGVQINNELEEHNRLLDDLDTHVDKTSTKIKRENKRITSLTEKSSNSCMLICIVFLVIVLVGGFATRWGCAFIPSKERC